MKQTLTDMKIKKLDVQKYFLQLNSYSNKIRMSEPEYQERLIAIISQTIGSFEIKINEIIDKLNSKEERIGK